MKKIIKLFLCIFISLQITACTKKDNSLSDVEFAEVEESQPQAKQDTQLKPEFIQNEEPTEEAKPSDNSVKHIISVPFHLQENNYYAGPACLQMTLESHGIAKSQDELAQQMNTDPMTGTEYQNLADIVNTYLYTPNPGPGVPGYRVQYVSSSDDRAALTSLFLERFCTDVSTNDPVFMGLDLNGLYPDMPHVTHMVLLIGYSQNTQTGDIETIHLLDPYYKTYNQVSNGEKEFPIDQVISALMMDDEPAYIW